MSRYFININNYEKFDYHICSLYTEHIIDEWRYFVESDRAFISTESWKYHREEIHPTQNKDENKSGKRFNYEFCEVFSCNGEDLKDHILITQNINEFSNKLYKRFPELKNVLTDFYKKIVLDGYIVKDENGYEFFAIKKEIFNVFQRHTLVDAQANILKILSNNNINEENETVLMQFQLYCCNLKNLLGNPKKLTKVEINHVYTLMYMYLVCDKKQDNLMFPLYFIAFTQGHLNWLQTINNDKIFFENFIHGFHDWIQQYRIMIPY